MNEPPLKPLEDRIRSQIELQLGRAVLTNIEGRENMNELRLKIRQLEAKLAEFERPPETGQPQPE